MIKIVSKILLLIFLSFATQAKEPIRYYGLTGASTPHLFMIEGWIKEIKKEISLDWLSGLSCGGKSAYVADKNPKMVEFVSGRAWQSLMENNTDCLIEMQDLQYLSLVEYSFDLCVLNDGKIKNIVDLDRNKKYRISVATANATQTWVKELNRLYGFEMKAAVFKASGDAMMALLSGDVELTFVSTLVADHHIKSGKIRCIGTTLSGMPTSLDHNFPKIHALLNTQVQMFPLAAKGLSQDTLSVARKAVVTVTDNSSLPLGIRVFVARSDEESLAIKKRVVDQIDSLYEVTKNIK